MNENTKDPESPKKKEELLEEFRVEMAIADGTYYFDAKFDQPLSAIAAAATLAAVFFPDVKSYRVIRIATNEPICVVPLQAFYARMGPKVNELAQSHAVGIYRMASSKSFEKLKKDQKERIRKLKKEKEKEKEKETK